MKSKKTSEKNWWRFEINLLLIFSFVFIVPFALLAKEKSCLNEKRNLAKAEKNHREETQEIEKNEVIFSKLKKDQENFLKNCNSPEKDSNCNPMIHQMMIGQLMQVEKSLMKNQNQLKFNELEIIDSKNKLDKCQLLGK